MVAGFIREVLYPTRLTNIVIVKKSNGKWRICVDFTDLNKACPKDSYSLPRIDRLVDATMGFKFLSSLDANSGYHQIPIYPEDEEKTTFITKSDIYYYRVIPFGLKNAKTTYQQIESYHSD
jgi:transcription antitermination factor NusA-like protein